MSIDACNLSFDDLARVVLPQYMVTLRASMTAAHPLSLFGTRGFGTKSILTELERVGDFSGCYVLLRAGTPFYVGISRTVVQRLRQHVTGRTHFDASLAYLMATKKTGHEMKRADAMKDTDFLRAFAEAQACFGIAAWRS